MPIERFRPFGLIGSITNDTIRSLSGETYTGWGGVLYQASALCGLGEYVILFAQGSQKTLAELRSLTSKWKLLDLDKAHSVPDPPNSVDLVYEKGKERREILGSVVPPLTASDVAAGLPGLSMLMLVFNSGFDIALSDWREIQRTSRAPVWMDVHSLALEPVLKASRRYRALSEWREWIRGADYLQANLQEVASMMGHPEKLPSEKEAADFAERALEEGLTAFFVTLGPDGVLVSAGQGTKKVSPPPSRRAKDTTGCGDVFGAATAFCISRGAAPLEAAEFGASLAASTAEVSGIVETFDLAKSCRTGA